MFYKVKIINERLERVNNDSYGESCDYFVTEIIEADTEKEALRKGVGIGQGISGNPNNYLAWNLDQCYAELVKD